jgi:uncharacterized protein involved in exopolysaccharide biosynthesis
MEDEVSIDLRQYLDVLVRRWRIVMSLTLVAVIVAGLNALAFPPGYEAVAGIAIVRVKTDIEFDPRFKTLSGDLVGTGYAQAVGAEPRRSALIGLVENGAIARQVVDELGDQLEPGERNPSGLLRKVSAELVENGDLIQIKVTNADPARAAAIANSWAQAYERHVNDIYGGMPIDQSSSIRVELERVQQD